MYLLRLFTKYIGHFSRRIGKFSGNYIYTEHVAGVNWPLSLVLWILLRFGMPRMSMYENSNDISQVSRIYGHKQSNQREIIVLCFHNKLVYIHVLHVNIST